MQPVVGLPIRGGPKEAPRRPEEMLDDELPNEAIDPDWWMDRMEEVVRELEEATG